VPALGQDGRRDLCPDRPGLGTPACTLDSGATMLETGIADWTLDRDADSRTDSFAFGGALLRTGLTPSLEVQIGWTMLGHVRERDRPTGRPAMLRDGREPATSRSRCARISSIPTARASRPR
jgi:hypothetical protein